MLTGKSGQLVSWALEGREQTLQVPLCLWGELWGNGQWGLWNATQRNTPMVKDSSYQTCNLEQLQFTKTPVSSSLKWD